MTVPASPGPPMIGALMRRPWDDVASRMLRALHEHGFTDLDAPPRAPRAGPGAGVPPRIVRPPHGRRVTDLAAPPLALLLWPGPDGLRPSELAARARMTR